MLATRHPDLLALTVFVAGAGKPDTHARDVLFRGRGPEEANPPPWAEGLEHR